MLVSRFRYPLPQDLIAQHPLPERRASRLLVLDGGTGALEDRSFADLPALLRAGDLLVLNDTRVVRARLVGRKPTGARVEVLVERSLEDGRFLAQVRASKAPKAGARIDLAKGVGVTVRGRREDLFELELDAGLDLAGVTEEHGAVPLPPYIGRAPRDTDGERYQTVYARDPGAVAAPTAGLHLDEEMLAALPASGVEVAYVTLHVGAGTFQPVRVECTQDHRMHAERVSVSEDTCTRLRQARERGGRVVAVGTTTVRALESACAGGEPAALDGETRLFIEPGYRFRVVDALVTNFHLPESTLLMLVCAFAATDTVLAAYRHAVRRGYRFFSYGDAMLVTRRAP